VKLGKESIIQIQVVEYCRQNHPGLPLYHVPMEGRRSFANAQILKHMGMVAGFADLFFPRGNKQFKGLFIELKAEGGRLTPAQSKFLYSMLNEGYEACCCEGSESAIEVIKKFYGFTDMTTNVV
jgi:hypothetical protein